MEFVTEPPPGSTLICTYSMGRVIWHVAPTTQQVEKVHAMLARIFDYDRSPSEANQV